MKAMMDELLSFVPVFIEFCCYYSVMHLHLYMLVVAEVL